MAAAASSSSESSTAPTPATGGPGWRPSEADVAQFQRDGYIIVRSLLTATELGKIRSEVEREDGVAQFAFRRDDGTGKTKSQLSLWNNPGDDLTGHVARNVRFVESFERLLAITGDNELYHYHTKLIMKDADKSKSASSGGSGRFVWHQDYGYWYNNGCLFPEMGTVMLAVDRCYSGNGCLEVLRGSHHAGRIEHTVVGEQTGANMERVKRLAECCPLDLVELEPGDACFFHCNLLHQSGVNTSADRRWCFLVSFNSKRNNPVYEHHHPKYAPLARLPEDSIEKADLGLPVRPEVKDFMVPVTYTDDGVTREVAEQWQARDGASSGVAMTTTAAAARAVAERASEEA